MDDSARICVSARSVAQWLSSVEHIVRQIWQAFSSSSGKKSVLRSMFFNQTSSEEGELHWMRLRPRDNSITGHCSFIPAPTRAIRFPDQNGWKDSCEKDTTNLDP